MSKDSRSSENRWIQAAWQLPKSIILVNAGPSRSETSWDSLVSIVTSNKAAISWVRAAMRSSNSSFATASSSWAIRSSELLLSNSEN